MSKQFLAILAAIIVVFVAVLAVGGKKTDTGSNAKSSSSNSSTLTQHIEGNTSAKVTLVEYGDYQCPYCQQYYSTVKQVENTYKDQIKFQFRNFPLTSVHHNAFAAARAAESAGMQNKYWEMHDILYENNDPTGATGWVASSDPSTYFLQFAKQIGLDTAKFKTDYASDAVNTAVNADMAEGTRLKITGTPSFFVNGKQMTFANTPSAFEKVLKPLIAKNPPATTSTTPATTETTTTPSTDSTTTSGQ